MSEEAYFAQFAGDNIWDIWPTVVVAVTEDWNTFIKMPSDKFFTSRLWAGGENLIWVFDKGEEEWRV